MHGLTGPLCKFMSEYCVVRSVTMYQLLLGIIQIVTSMMVIVFIEYYTAMQVHKRRQKVAMSTLEGALMVYNERETLVLPLYFVLLWGMVVTDVFHGVCTLVCPANIDASSSLGCSVAQGLSYGMFHTVLEGSALFMCRQGAGIQSLTQAAKWGGVWGVFTSVMYMAPFNADQRQQSVAILLVWESMLFVFYLVIWLAPAHVLFRRPSVLAFAGFFVLKYGLSIIGDSMVMFGYEMGYCISMFSTLVLWAIARPLVFYRMLFLDSLYWQGCFPGNTGPNTYWRDLVRRFAAFRVTPQHMPLLGFAAVKHAPHLPPVSARHLAEQVDMVMYGSSVRPHIPIINFAHLSLGTGTVIGAGGTAKVYLGELDGQVVAVKMLYPMELTMAKVGRFVKECQLLCSLHHPNIIEVRGFCVVPPSVCFCMELAARGSLYDEIRTNYSSLTWSMRYRMCLDCVRAIAHLHRQLPPVLHNDIKSLNFFVMADGTIKLGDFDFCTFDAPGETQSPGSEPEHVPGPSRMDRSSTNRTSRSSVHVISNIPQTLNWLAPEVILRGECSTASDVYSLGLVFWEIGSGKVPYDTPEFNVNSSALRTTLLETHQIPNPGQMSSWPVEFVALLLQCWDPDPSNRPSADDVLNVMQSLWVQTRSVGNLSAPASSASASATPTAGSMILLQQQQEEHVRYLQQKQQLKSYSSATSNSSNNSNGNSYKTSNNDNTPPPPTTTTTTVLNNNNNNNNQQ